MNYIGTYTGILATRDPGHAFLLKKIMMLFPSATVLFVAKTFNNNIFLFLNVSKSYYFLNTYSKQKVVAKREKHDVAPSSSK